MSAGDRLIICPVPAIYVLLLVFTSNISSGHGTPPSQSCPPSSCGNITNIKFPFRLKTGPRTCGFNDSNFQLDCLNNRTILGLRDFAPTTDSRMYYVQEINYKNRRVRVVDPGVNKKDLSSCLVNDPWGLNTYGFNQHEASNFDELLNVAVAFVHCLSFVNSAKYVKASFCGNASNLFGNSSKFYSYVMVGDPDLLVSDLEESCTVDNVGWVSNRRAIMDKSSLISIYDDLAYGFDLSWTLRQGCDKYISFRMPYDIILAECCYGLTAPGTCINHLRLPATIALKGVLAVAEVIAIRILIGFLIGFPLLSWLVVHKWQRRHQSMDKIIEKFLQDQHSLTSIKYCYSDIKKITNNFNQRLGEGAFSIVYKGKLQSGFYVAVKMMEQSMSSEEEFINEVDTICRIHHVNVVQLVGFCVERSKYALVYEFLSNGSLDRYIFNQQSLGVLALTFDKMFEIALGVARGMNYLHHGCNMQILHFDIKPHNILLDEKFNPKISDFGLARLHPTDESFINLTAARGTLGYMAPELFYRNIGGISYKADVYSFGMMLLEIASRRKNMNHLLEDTSQMYFPSWVYDQLCAGKNIEIQDATEEERKIVKKILIVALWCIQMAPSIRPSMNKVVEMLEGEFHPQMPPKPFIAPHEIAVDHGITQTYSVDYISLNLGSN